MSAVNYLSTSDQDEVGIETTMDLQLAAVKGSTNHHDRVVYNYILVLYRQVNAQLLLKLVSNNNLYIYYPLVFLFSSGCDNW